jgi:hypothetical protein
MGKFFAFFGYIWAIVCVLLIPLTFIGNDQFAKQLAKLPFMKVNPLYTGGEADQVLKQDSLTVVINKPVFEALLGQSSQGFVQVKFIGKSSLPATIKKAIDFNHDGVSDFVLNIDTRNGGTTVVAMNSNVKGLLISSKVKKDWIVRVKLKNPNK